MRDIGPLRHGRFGHSLKLAAPPAGRAPVSMQAGRLSPSDSGISQADIPTTSVEAP
jgi:hypothetical protein